MVEELLRSYLEFGECYAAVRFDSAHSHGSPGEYVFDFAVVIFGVRGVLPYVSHMANHLAEVGVLRTETLDQNRHLASVSSCTIVWADPPWLLTALITPFSQHRTNGFATSTLYLCV